MKKEYRLVVKTDPIQYYNGVIVPNYCFALQVREDNGTLPLEPLANHPLHPWCTIPTVNFTDLTKAEQDEIFETSERYIEWQRNSIG